MVDCDFLKNSKHTFQNLPRISLDNLIRMGVTDHSAGFDRIASQRPPKVHERISKAAHPIETVEIRLGEPATPKGLRKELVPWALGTGDPVRDRVEAREREGLSGER